jgi:hypothetical protein
MAAPMGELFGEPATAADAAFAETQAEDSTAVASAQAVPLGDGEVWAIAQYAKAHGVEVGEVKIDDVVASAGGILYWSSLNRSVGQVSCWPKLPARHCSRSQRTERVP